MKIENQVVNLELAKELKKNGYEQEGLWWWDLYYYENHNKKLVVCHENQTFWDGNFKVAAPTVAELGERLKEVANHNECKLSLPSWNIFRKQWGNLLIKTWSDTEADARAKCLLYLVKNDIITLGGNKK